MAIEPSREELMSVYRINAETISKALFQVNAFLKYLFVLGGSLFAAFLLNYSELIDPISSLFVVLLICVAFMGVSIVISYHMLGALSGDLLNLKIELKLGIGEYGNGYNGYAIPNMSRKDGLLTRAGDFMTGTKIYSFWVFAVVVVGFMNAVALSIAIPLSVFLLFGLSYLVGIVMGVIVFFIVLFVYIAVIKYDFKTFIYPLHKEVVDALERKDSKFFEIGGS